MRAMFWYEIWSVILNVRYLNVNIQSQMGKRLMNSYPLHLNRYLLINCDRGVPLSLVTYSLLRPPGSKPIVILTTKHVKHVRNRFIWRKKSRQGWEGGRQDRDENNQHILYACMKLSRANLINKTYFISLLRQMLPELDKCISLIFVLFQIFFLVLGVKYSLLHGARDLQLNYTPNPFRYWLFMWS